MSFKYSGFMMVTLGAGPNHVKEFLPTLFFLIRISTGPLMKLKVVQRKMKKFYVEKLA